MRFSVLMSIYEKERPDYFQQAMESIWDLQILKPTEIVLVEDGKLTDELYDLINHWKIKLAEKLKIISLKRNQGLAKALNIGIEYCEGEFIARMDTDDISLPDRFKKQVDYLNKYPDIDILGSWAFDIDSEGNEISLRRVPSNHSDIIKYIWTCPLIHPTVFINRKAINGVGLYNETLKRRQDYELWFRCVQHGLKFANLPEHLLLYRFTEDWFKKNNSRVIWEQVRIGWRGCRLIGAPPRSYIGTAFPLIKILLPPKAVMKLLKIFKKLDPRNNSF